MGLFTRSTMRWGIGMKVTVKNLPMHLVFGEYNGQECEVQEEFHSRQYGTSLRVRAMDGRLGFTVGTLPSTSRPKLMLSGLQPWPSLNASSSWPRNAPNPALQRTVHDLDRGNVTIGVVFHMCSELVSRSREASPRNGSMCHRSQQMGST